MGLLLSLALMFLSSLVAGVSAAAEPTPQFTSVLPERSTSVVVSNRDVNRVYCPRAVEDVVWSAEKPVKITQQGQHVFVKFLIARVGTVESPVTSTFDLHVVCGGEVYTLIMHPRAMDSVTIRLGDPQRAELANVAKDWGGLALEDRIKRLTLAVYRNEIPDSFSRRRIEPSDPRRHVAVFENAEVIGQQEIVAPGTGLKATEYIVHAKEAMQLDERDFLTPLLGQIVGLTVDPLTVPADGFARLIVVERGGDHVGE
jgi:hypothetical protein